MMDDDRARFPRWPATREILWLLLASLPPLWVNLWGQQPFELSKASLVRTLVWLLAGVAVAETILGRRSPGRSLRANPLAGPLALLGLVVVVTTALAVDWRLSLWGSYARAQGAVTLLTYLLVSLLAAGHLGDLARVRRLLIGVTTATIPLILVSLLQVAGWNPFGLVSDARSVVHGTLGRSNFVGAYLALVTPLTLALLLTTDRRRSRLLWSTVLVGQIGVTALTLARGAWLALSVSLLLFSLLWWGRALSARLRHLAWIAVGLLFLAGPLTVLGLGPHQQGSLGARLAIWRGTLELIGQRPLLGYGADSLGIVFPRVYPPHLVYLQGRDFFIDRAHNLLLDWTVTAGLPGLLAISLVLVVFAHTTGRALIRTDSPSRRALLVGIVAGVAGNLASNMVSFDVTPTATATWLLMGAGVALSTPSSPHGDLNKGVAGVGRWALAGLLLVGIGTAVWQVNVRPVLADSAARAFQRHAKSGDWLAASEAAARAVALWPLEPAHHLRLGNAYWRLSAREPAAAEVWLPRAESTLLAARRLRPADGDTWLHSARFYAAATRHHGADMGDPAEEAFRRAVSLAPNQAAAWLAWGRFHLDTGNPSAAAPLLRRAVQLDTSDGAAYVDLGAAELVLGRLEIALADYAEATRLIPRSSRAHAGLAACLWQLGRTREALAAVEEALRWDPRNPRALALRAAMAAPSR